MINRERRVKLAFHLRQLTVGLITNDDFEGAIMDDVSDGWLPEQYYRSKRSKRGADDAVITPLLELSWSLYDDTKRHKLTGHRQLTKEAYKHMARYILFLHSDLEYEWPYLHMNNTLFRFSIKDLLLYVFTLGFHFQKKKLEQMIAFDEWQKHGDYEVWPFYRKSDYEAQLLKRPFLAGRATC